MISAQRNHDGHRAVPAQPTAPKPGDLLLVTREASVQFLEPLLFRVIRVCDRPTYDGWLWLIGYGVRPDGSAIQRREIFVQAHALRPGRLT